MENLCKTEGWFFKVEFWGLHHRSPPCVVLSGDVNPLQIEQDVEMKADDESALAEDLSVVFHILTLKGPANSRHTLVFVVPLSSWANRSRDSRLSAVGDEERRWAMSWSAKSLLPWTSNLSS